MSEAESIVIRPGITKSEQTFFVPVKVRPKMLRVDPGLTVLAEIKEEKALDWWKQQLKAPTVAERIRAVEHFTGMKSKQRHELLAGVLSADPFYGVRVEAPYNRSKTFRRSYPERGS